MKKQDTPWIMNRRDFVAHYYGCRTGSGSGSLYLPGETGTGSGKTKKGRVAEK